MPTLYDIKPRFQRMLCPLCRALHRAGVTPNQITFATLLACCAMGTWLYLGIETPLPFLLLPAFLFVRMAANALDGMLARQYALDSRAGAWLNEAGDIVSDLALYLPFAALPCVQPGLALTVAVLAVATELAGLAGTASGGGRRHDGPMGKSDRAAAFGALGLLYGVGAAAAWLWTLLLVALLLLLALTIGNRLRRLAQEAC